MTLLILLGGSLWEIEAPRHTHSTVTHIYSKIDTHINK